MRLLHLLALVLLSSTFASEGSALPTGRSQNVSVELVSERGAIQPGQPFQVGLWMKLNPGWHTYWKQPGDAGLPLRIEWRLPPGYTAGPIEWPTPVRIPTEGLVSYGYEDDVLLPVTITPPARIDSDSVAIGGRFDWLECKDVCLSGSADLDLVLRVARDPGNATPSAPRFERTRRDTPRPPEGWSMNAVAGPRAIEVAFRPPAGVRPRGGYLFVDEPLVVEHAAPQGFQRTSGGYRLIVIPAENAQEPPKRITGVLVLDGVSSSNARAVAVNVAATAGDPSPDPPQTQTARTGWPPYAIFVALAGIALGVYLRRRKDPRTQGERT